MKHGCTHILALLMLLSTWMPMAAQVSIRASADRDKILIGEPVNITVEAYAPPGSEISWFRADSIEHFQIVKTLPPDTVPGLDTKKMVQVLTVTSFDSGRWTVPPFEVSVGGKPYYSDSLTLDVAFLSFDPKEDYHDIKDIIVVENPWLRYIPWIVSSIALLSLAFLIILLRKTKSKPAAPVKPEVKRLNAYERAMKALDLLQKKGVADGDVKSYYTLLNDILRQYVADKFGVSTFERTNDELIFQLSAMGLPQTPFTSLTQSLRMIDFVKFAKYHPSDDDNKDNAETVRRSIGILNNYSQSAV